MHISTYVRWLAAGGREEFTYVPMSELLLVLADVSTYVHVGIEAYGPTPV